MADLEAAADTYIEDEFLKEQVKLKPKTPEEVREIALAEERNKPAAQAVLAVEAEMAKEEDERAKEVRAKVLVKIIEEPAKAA